jgi:hypothetical protein
MSRRGKYKYSIWCEECLGVDPNGCFHGKAFVVSERFNTSDEAEAALEKNIRESLACVPSGQVFHVELEGKK